MLKTLAIVLGLLMAMHAIAMMVNNNQNSKKGYQSQNLILSVFYIIFSVILLGGAISTHGAPSAESGYYRV
jgi:membrane protein insertase Oxa1/YidC/SpoIIIJ